MDGSHHTSVIVYDRLHSLGRGEPSAPVYLHTLALTQSPRVISRTYVLRGQL